MKLLPCAHLNQERISQTQVEGGRTAAAAAAAAFCDRKGKKEEKEKEKDDQKRERERKRKREMVIQMGSSSWCKLYAS